MTNRHPDPFRLIASRVFIGRGGLLAVLFVAALCSSARAGGPLTHEWSQSFGDSSYQTMTGMATDASNNAIVVGYYEGTIDFGGGSLTSAGGRDIFLAKFNSALIIARPCQVWSCRPVVSPC